MRQVAIEAFGLTKCFGQLVAVDHIDFKVYRNEVFGFLGPNGAGKTTTLRMLTCIFPPDEGHASVAGFDVLKDSIEVKKRIGVVLQGRFALDLFLNIEDNLDIFAKIHDVPKLERKKRIAKALKLLGLDKWRTKKAELLSPGLIRRVQIARLMMKNFPILFLDEPTVGLDPHARRIVWDIIRKVTEKGQTVFLTTHSMEEADSLCDRVAIIDRGRLIAMDTPDTLKCSIKGTNIVEINLTKIDKKLKKTLEALSYVKDIRMIERNLFIHVDEENVLPDVVDEVRSLGCEARKVAIRKPSLEDVFLRLTGREFE